VNWALDCPFSSLAAVLLGVEALYRLVFRSRHISNAIDRRLEHSRKSFGPTDSFMR